MSKIEESLIRHIRAMADIPLFRVIEENLIQRIRDRATMGLRKYGTTLERDDYSLSDWILHAHEECMDFALYLERINAMEIDDERLERFVHAHRDVLAKACLQLETFLDKYK